MRILLVGLLFCAACAPDAPPAPPEPAPADRPPMLNYRPPAEWTPQPPASKLRKAQYAVRDKDNAEADAEMAYFGVAGGTFEQNLERWKGQFKRREADPKVEKIAGAALPLTLVEIVGDYAPEMGGEPCSDAMLLVALVETDRGTEFFKLIGPRGTVADWRDAFVEMLKGARLD